MSDTESEICSRLIQTANAEHHFARNVCDRCGGRVTWDAGIWRHEDPAEPAVVSASKLDVKSGDTLVFRGYPGFTPDELLAIKSHFHEIGKDVSVCSLPDDMKIESLDEDHMRRAGWVRASPEALTFTKPRLLALMMNCAFDDLDEAQAEEILADFLKDEPNP